MTQSLLFVISAFLILSITLATLVFPLRPLRQNKKTTGVLLIFVPLLSILSYLFLGSPGMLEPNTFSTTAQQEQGDSSNSDSINPDQITPELIAQMVSKLEQKQKKNPDNLPGWLMLGRSYKTLGEYAKAAKAFEKAESLIGNDVKTLMDYAESLAMSPVGTGQRAGFKGTPTKLIKRALKLEPNHPNVLLLAGAAEFADGKLKAGANYWRQLLPMLPAGSEMETVLKEGIARAEEEAKKDTPQSE